MKLKFFLHGIIPRFYYRHERRHNYPWIQTETINILGYTEDLLAICSQKETATSPHEKEGWRNYELKKL